MAIVLYDTMLYIWCSRCKESKTIHLQGGTTMAEKVKYITVDKQEVYENEIKPLVDHLKSLLCHYEMAFFFAAAVKSDEEGTEYIYESNDPWSTSLQLKDDKIPGFIKVTKGFKTVLPDHIEIEL